MTAEEKGFLSAIKKAPKDATARGAYADWLDEHGRAYEAMLQRGAAGLSEVSFKVRRKSDGLFSEGKEQHYGKEMWTTKGKMWRKLVHLRSHFDSYVKSHYRQQAREHRHQRDQEPAEFLYMGDTPISDVEIVVVEVRLTIGARMSLSIQHDEKDKSIASINIAEPGGEGTSPTE
jgi:uncharacterized protein (TIGR02996 family)